MDESSETETQISHATAYLRERRKALGLSQRAVASKAGISAGYIAQLETGRATKPSYDMLERLARAYGVEIATLLREMNYEVGSLSELSAAQLEWAYNCVRLDPHWIYGVQAQGNDLSLATKAFLVEVYEKATGRKLLTEQEHTTLAEIRHATVYEPYLTDLIDGLLDVARQAIEIHDVGLSITVTIVQLSIEMHLRKLAVKFEVPVASGSTYQPGPELNRALWQQGVFDIRAFLFVEGWLVGANPNVENPNAGYIGGLVNQVHVWMIDHPA